MTLAKKFIIVVIVSVVGLLLPTSIILSDTINHSVERIITQSGEESTSRALDKIDRFLYERTIDLQIISGNQYMEDAITKRTTATTKNATSTLASIKTTSGVWNELTLQDISGVIVASTNPQDLKISAISIDINNLGKLKILYDLYLEASQGKITYSDLMPDPTTNQPTMVFMAPVRSLSDKKVIGVISGRVSWPAVEEVLKNHQNENLVLLSKNGIELGTNTGDVDGILTEDMSGTEAYKRMSTEKAQTGSMILPEFDETDEEVLISYASEQGFQNYAGNGWYLASFVPTSQAFKDGRRIAVYVAVGLGAGALLIVTLLILAIRKQIARPIRKLVEAVERITGGDWEQQVQVSSNDEIGNLAESFNAMTSQLTIARSQLEQEKLRLEVSINSLPLGFMLINAENRIIKLNPEISRMTGADIKNVQDSDSKEFIELVKVVLSHSHECLENVKPVSHSYTTKAGKFLRIIISPMMDHGKVAGAVALIEDITEAKVLERSKDEFFSIASHELRTPLTAIRGNTSMIKQFYERQLKDRDLNQMVNDIHDSSVRLIEIVNDFLDASRLEQGKMELTSEDFDLAAVIENVIYEMGAVIKEKNLYLKAPKTLKSLPQVHADKNRVKRILYNLTGNALKFTEEGGITIDAEVKGKLMHVTVTDTGRGIPKDKQVLLFHKFQQAGENLFTRDTTRGTGLGLYISKLLSEKMGGTLTLDKSIEGKGTTFSFTLPIAQHKPDKS